jgi:hypothetical protein
MIKIWECTIPMDAQGYLPTKQAAIKWLHKLRKQNARLYDRKPNYQDGATISEITVKDAAQLCALINDNSRHFDDPEFTV